MKTEILIICNNQPILETVVRLVNNNENWRGTGVSTEEDALNIFRNQPFDLILMGGGTEGSFTPEIRNSFLEINPNVAIVPHYGGGSGLLYAEIMGALAGQDLSS